MGRRDLGRLTYQHVSHSSQALDLAPRLRDKEASCRGTTTFEHKGKIMSNWQTMLLASIAMLGLAGGLHAQEKKKQPPVVGTLKYGSKTHKLQHVVAYQTKRDGGVSTVLFLSEKPMPKMVLDMLTKELKSKGNDEDLVIFEAFLFVRLHLHPEFEPSGNIMLADGAGFNIGSKLEQDLKVADGRVAGAIKMAEPKEVFDQKYFFEAKVNAPLIHTAK